MQLSLADFNVDDLTPRGRSIFDAIARPIAEDDLTPEEVATRLGVNQQTGKPWTAREVNAAMKELGAEMAAKKFGGRLPDMRQDDYEAFLASIRQYGQLVPILVDADGQIVDGGHRHRACLDLGVDPWKVELRYTPATREEWHAVALAVNIARRQLSSAQKRDVVSAEIRRYPNASDRSIAALLGVSATTVGTVRRQLQQRGEVSILDTRQDAQGRSQPVGPDLGVWPETTTITTGLYEALLELERHVRESARSGEPVTADDLDRLLAAIDEQRGDT